MPTYTNPLEHVRVAAPCPADWAKMVGDERVRYCNQCELHVYNLSGMTRREAEALVTSSEGRLCVRFYRRADGTILTRNCPTGLSALKRRASRAAAATMTAVLGFFAGLGLNFGVDRALSPAIMGESAVPAPQMPAPEVGASDCDAEVVPKQSVPALIQGQAVIVREPMMGLMAAPADGHEMEAAVARGRREARRQR